MTCDPFDATPREIEALLDIGFVRPWVLADSVISDDGVKALMLFAALADREDDLGDHLVDAVEETDNVRTLRHVPAALRRLADKIEAALRR